MMRHDADGLPLILIGGTLCDERLWKPMLDGWHVDAAPVTAGAPFADRPVTMAAYASDLLRRLPPRAVLVGYSLGGLVALELVAQAPERFGQLVLVCAGAGPETAEGAAKRRADEARAEHGMRAHVADDLLPRYGIGSGGTIAGLLADMAETVGIKGYSRQNDLAVTRADSRHRLVAIERPVLLVSGERDPFCPPERHEEMASFLPDATRHVVPACGHMVPLERPWELRGIITQLLAN